MAERPPIRATGRITQVHQENRLFEVEMVNGYRAYAVLERKGPPIPENTDLLQCEAEVEYSPYDMSRCKIVGWNVPASVDGAS